MRPPLNAGENASTARSDRRTAARFNEAPAERGGKLQKLAGLPLAVLKLQ